MAFGAIAVAVGVLCAIQDTVVVKANNAPVWGRGPKVVEEVRIGTLQGGEEYTFGRVLDVAVAEDGTVWVADAQDHAIRRYSPDGRFIDRIGRSGKGPGEFGALGGLERLPDGRFAAWDTNLGRVSLFTSEGRFLKTISLAMMPVISIRNNVIDAFRADRNGRLFLIHVSIDRDDGARFRWLLVDTAGSVHDSIPYPSPETFGPSGAFKDYPFARMLPFSTTTRGSPSPAGYLVIGRNSAYAFSLPRPDGKVLRIERSWEPAPVGRQERAEWEALVTHAERRGSNRGGTSIPDRKPPYWGFWVDQEARIWVARHTTAVRIPESESERAKRTETGAPPTEWWEPLVLDVIDPAGRFLGTVRLKDRKAVPKVARGNKLWVLEQGEFDEQYVVRYRIEAG